MSASSVVRAGAAEAAAGRPESPLGRSGVPRGGGLLAELAGLLLPVVMPIVRRLPAVVLALCALLTTVCVATLIGAARDDAAIEAHPVVTTAEVLPGSSFARTLVRFTTSDGKLLVPEKGVFYPRGLSAGQVIPVQYDATSPDRVRVLGRDVSVGYRPVGLMLLALWATLLPLAWWLRGRQRRQPGQTPSSA